MSNLKSDWHTPYLGIQYESGGRGRALDCWGLVERVYRERLNIELPLFDGNDNRFADGFSRVYDAQEYDLALFDAFPARSHVGVVLDPIDMMLHASQNLGVVVTKIAMNGGILPEFYRWTK